MRSKVLLISKGKGKARQLQSSWGSMLGMPNAQTDHAQHNPLKGKARQLQSSWGAMLGMSNALWIMRSIILFKAVKVNFEAN